MKIIENFGLLPTMRERSVKLAAVKNASMAPAKAVLAMVALAMLTALAGGQTAAALGYHEYENPPCYDITGSTTAFLVGGVNNGGIMNFDDAGVDLQYQACVRMSAAGPTGVPQRLEGWVWNDNLGWVSMYCDGNPGGDGIIGTGDDVIGSNFGIACGAQQYSVTFTPSGGTSPDFTTVTMSGSGWGDNIGYISFNSAFHQMQPTPNGANRGLVSAASPAAQKYAWADSVGWLDFSGVKFRWEAESIIPQLHDVKIWNPTLACDLASGCVPTVAQTPVADASQDYTIEIPFKDGAVSLTNLQVRDCGADVISMYAPSPGAEPYCARVKLEWVDHVDLNQTTLASQNAGANPYGLTTAPGGPGAVIKPLVFTLTGGDLTYDGVKRIWGANVRSYAPTSDRNIADGMQLEKFNYADTTDLPDTSYVITKTDQNKLRLAKVNLMLFKYSTGAGIPGQCIMGEIKDPVPIAPPNPYTCNLHTYIENINMPFKPLVEITKLVHNVAGKELNFINIENVESPQYFGYQLARNAATAIVGFAAVFDVGLALDWNYSFQFDVAGTLSYEQTVSSETAVGTLTGKLTQITPGSAFSTGAGPYLFSTISYTLGGKAVTYFANKLPRIAAGILKNPVALVQGNVYLTDYAPKASDVTLRSLGNISSNLRREQIYRNVQNYLRGFNPTATGNKTVATKMVNAIAGLDELVTDKVFYLRNGNLTIDCGPTCAFDRDVTFIVENGNILVNSDIVPAPGKQVGLIALRNLDGNVMTQGFVNIDKEVKWLSRVHVFADRVLQSYDKTALVWDSNGFYRLDGDDLARQNVFKHQLVFEGTMSSMNGIGNASANPATDELGTDIGGVAGATCASYNADTLAGICRARVVDLNYLRYYGPGLEICTGSEGMGAVANVPRDQQLRADVAQGGGCNPDPATGYAIDASVLFTEQPAFGDLISGGATGGLPSAYFSGKPVSIKNEFPVNFFYVPISENLGGFEREQEFNPIIQ